MSPEAGQPAVTGFYGLKMIGVAFIRDYRNADSYCDKDVQGDKEYLDCPFYPVFTLEHGVSHNPPSIKILPEPHQVPDHLQWDLARLLQLPPIGRDSSKRG